MTITQQEQNWVDDSNDIFLARTAIAYPSLTYSQANDTVLNNRSTREWYIHLLNTRSIRMIGKRASVRRLG